MPNPVANPQQARDIMRGAKPRGGPPNEFRPPNLYYNHGNAREIFHPPTGLQTANGYISIQNEQGDPQNFDDRKQIPPINPGPSNSQDVMFMDGVTELHHDESVPFQMGEGKVQSQWPSHTNAITYKLRSLDDGIIHNASRVGDDH